MCFDIVLDRIDGAFNATGVATLVVVLLKLFLCVSRYRGGREEKTGLLTLELSIYLKVLEFFKRFCPSKIFVL